ncbi:MAG: PIN domain-containing protein [Acidobacteria bacterium]|nr:PIN domain-containing protein [Acidobacteriota bacterium]
MSPTGVERRFSLDSNILVYAADQDAGANRHGTSVALIEQAAKSDCVLTLQSLTEFFSATTRKRLLRPQDAGAFVSDWLAVFPVAPNAAVDLAEAMRVLEGYRISFWDAMLWATARRAGCSAILSEDFQDGQVLQGVRFINPFLRKNNAYVEALLGS